MATKGAVGTLAENAVEPSKAVYVKKTYSPEYLAEQEAIMTRVREEGAKRIRRSCERLEAMGIIDKDGNRLKAV